MNKTTSMSGWSTTLVSIGLYFAAAAVPAQEADPAALEIIESLSLRESAEPIRNHQRWAEPRKVVVAYWEALGGSKEQFLSEMQAVAGDAEVVLFDLSDPDVESIKGADVYISYCSPRVVKNLQNLRWIHSYGVGVDRCLSDSDVRELDFIMSNNQRLSAPSIAEFALGMALMLNNNMANYQKAQDQKSWTRSGLRMTSDLSGKTMLVLGLGGIGTETARRASAFGMRVIATRNSSRKGPAFVAKVGLSDEMYELAGEADFVVNALPLTPTTNGLVDRKFFDALKPGAYYVNVGRGKTTVTGDLIAALNTGTLAGAGLDVTDPEPLPSDHPLWAAKNVVITPHIAANSSDSDRRMLVIARENLRRYVQGERLLSVVDVERGY